MVPVLNHLLVDVACYGNHGWLSRPLHCMPGTYISKKTLISGKRPWSTSPSAALSPGCWRMQYILTDV